MPCHHRCSQQGRSHEMAESNRSQVSPIKTTVYKPPLPQFPFDDNDHTLFASTSNGNDLSLVTKFQGARASSSFQVWQITQEITT